MSTRYELHFRSTPAGTGTGHPYGEASPNAYVINDLYNAGTPIRNGLSFGFTSTSNIFKADWSGAPADRISGRAQVSGSNPFRVDLPDGPGIYKIWLALGALTATSPTGLQLLDSDGTTNLISPGAIISGGPVAGSVIDAITSPMTAAAWIAADGGTPVTVTVSGDHFFIVRSGTLYLANVSWQLQPITLVDAVLTNDLGNTLTTIYAGQPQGKRLVKISAAGAKNFALSGTLASYFALATDSAGNWWIVASGTRLPDAASGTLTVIQTDSNGSPTTHTTNVIGGTSSVTITSSQGRPTTGNLGDISTEAWLARKTVITGTTGAFAGWTNQSFATDPTPVTSAAALVTAIQNAINVKTGSSWHRIRVAAGGDWTTDMSIPSGDFGTGGLLITPSSGNGPNIDGAWNNSGYLRGFHLENLTLSMGSVHANGGFYGFDLTGGSPGNYHKLKVNNCRIGIYFSSSFDLTQFKNWPTAIFTEIGEDIVLTNNQIAGVNDVLNICNYKRIVDTGNDAFLVYGDFLAFSDVYTASNATPWTDMYIYSANHTPRASPDVFGTGGTSFLHPDTYQLRTPQRYWRIDKDPVTGNPIGFTPGGDFTYVNPNNGNVYVASNGAAGTTSNAGTGPSGTGTSIADGTVTWNFVKAYTPPKIHFFTENMAISAGGKGSYVDKNNKLVFPGRSLLQDNLTAVTFNMTPPDLTFVNIAQASTDQRGVIAVNANVIVEFCTLTAPSTVPDYDSAHVISLDAKTIQLTGTGTLRAYRNILGYNGSTSGPYITVTDPTKAKMAVQDNIAAAFLSGAPAGSTANNMLAGTFTQRAGDALWTFTLDDSPAVSPLNFQSNFSKMMRPKTGRYGARLKELYTVTVAGTPVPLEVDP